MTSHLAAELQRSEFGNRYQTGAVHVLEPALDRLLYSDEVGYRIEAREVRFREVGVLAAQYADAALRAGVSVGEPVALAGPPTVEWVGAAFGLLAAGAALTPINHNLTPLEVGSMLARSKIERFAAVPGCPLSGSAAITPTASGSCRPLELRGSADDVAIVLHTSGSTGPPKAVQLTHENLIQSLHSFLNVFGCTGTDRTCIAVPLFHITGLLDQLLQMVWLGGMCRLLTLFTTAEMLRSLVVDEITVMFSVPTVFALLVRTPPTSPLSLRLAVYGGSPIGRPTVDALLDLIPGVRPVQGYGMTEMSSLATALPFGALLDSPASVGVPSPITELRIIDDNGNDSPKNEIGEILMRGPHRTPGYRGDPEATERIIDEQGWLHSGDLAWRDHRNLIYLAGRSTEIINRGGEKISPREIEAVLCDVRGVSEAVAFSVPDDVMYQVPAAVIVTEPGVRLRDRDLFSALECHLAAFKHPVQILRLVSIPMTAGGKPDFHKLRAGLER